MLTWHQINDYNRLFDYKAVHFGWFIFQLMLIRHKYIAYVTFISFYDCKVSEKSAKMVRYGW